MKCFRGLLTLVPSPIISLIFQGGMRSSYATSNVTTLFWPRQDGPQFKAQPADCEQLKKPFSLTVCQVRIKLYYQAKIAHTEISFSGTLTEEEKCLILYLCTRSRSFALGNDAKILRSRDTQCNTEETR